VTAGAEGLGAGAESTATASPVAAGRQPVQPQPAPERKVPAAGYAAPSGRADDEEASPVADLVATTVLAASELAQIGIDVGRAAIRSMIERLPKP